jgi:flagellar export protein FliJ
LKYFGSQKKALEDKQLEMAQIQTRLTKANDTLYLFFQQQEQAKAGLEKILDVGGDISFIKIKNHQDYMSKLSSDILNQHRLIADIENELELKQEEVREALKAQKMLEKLKENEYEKFLKDFEHREMKELDDITLTRYRGPEVV